jgi:hypothetical protein
MWVECGSAVNLINRYHPAEYDQRGKSARSTFRPELAKGAVNWELLPRDFETLSTADEIQPSLALVQDPPGH